MCFKHLFKKNLLIILNNLISQIKTQLSIISRQKNFVSYVYKAYSCQYDEFNITKISKNHVFLCSRIFYEKSENIIARNTCIRY